MKIEIFYFTVVQGMFPAQVWKPADAGKRTTDTARYGVLYDLFAFAKF